MYEYHVAIDYGITWGASTEKVYAWSFDVSPEAGFVYFRDERFEIIFGVPQSRVLSVKRGALALDVALASKE